MLFNEYEKDGRIIHATEFAYEAIYKAQGYKPVFDTYSIFNFPNFTPSTGGDENVMFSFDVETEETPAPDNVKTQNLSENLSEARLEFYIKKFVLDCLDYMHRQDFPEALVYSAVDLIRKRIADESASFVESSEVSVVSSNVPLSKIKQDDTEYTFAVNNVDLSGCLADLDFDSIKPKLNLYRRMVSW